MLRTPREGEQRITDLEETEIAVKGGHKTQQVNISKTNKQIHILPFNKVKENYSPKQGNIKTRHKFNKTITTPKLTRQSEQDRSQYHG